MQRLSWFAFSVVILSFVLSGCGPISWLMTAETTKQVTEDDDDAPIQNLAQRISLKEQHTDRIGGWMRADIETEGHANAPIQQGYAS